MPSEGLLVRRATVKEKLCMHGEQFNIVSFIDFIMNKFILFTINTETVSRITDMKRHSGIPYNTVMQDSVSRIQSTFQIVLTSIERSSSNITKERQNPNI
jgi:hypothetical protein